MYVSRWSSSFRISYRFLLISFFCSCIMCRMHCGKVPRSCQIVVTFIFVPSCPIFPSVVLGAGTAVFLDLFLRVFVFRDIKPSNILLDSEGTKPPTPRLFPLGILSLFLGHCYLTDFSVACVCDDSRRLTSLAGTKPYMGM